MTGSGAAGAGENRGLLFDSTLCVGCGGCYLACKESNRLPWTAADHLGDVLSDRTYTVVEQHGGRFVRRLCMHCVVPACVSVCPVGALEKTSLGPVVYHEDRCIGCRYCMQACPFSIPRYEWQARRPRVRKCDLCAERLQAGLKTACAAACPTGATGCGRREELIAAGRDRLHAAPKRYSGGLYGLYEAGGTAVMLMAAAPLSRLGYPGQLGEKPLPLLTWAALSRVPRFAVAGSVALAGLWWITRRREEVARFEADEERRRRVPDGPPDGAENEP